MVSWFLFIVYAGSPTEGAVYAWSGVLLIAVRAFIQRQSRLGFLFSGTALCPTSNQMQ